MNDVGISFGKGDSSFWALRNVNLVFPIRGCFAIKGKSGSGKSTLLNLIAKLLDPTEGHIYFQGKDIAHLKGNQLADFRLHNIALVYQHYNLISGSTCLENVALPLLMSGASKRKANQKAKSLLASFGLEKFSKKKVDRLSGGEKQRVAIARSLINEPEILLADEPTGALDSSNSRSVMETLKEIAKDRLVIFVSHNDELINEYADQVIEVKDGCVESLINKEEEIQTAKKDKTKRHGHGWIGYFVGRNFRKNWVRNLIMFFSGVLGFSFLLLSLGFYLGSSESLEVEQSRNLEFQSAFISQKSYIDIEGSPLQLVKKVRPDIANVMDALEGIDRYSLENDYSFFFPSYSSYSLDGEKQDPVSFVSVYDLSLTEGNSSLLSRGRLPKQNDFSCVLVNGEYASLFDFDIVGSNVLLTNEFDVEYEGAKDHVSYSFSFLITGVVDEFSFLNSPKIYYSYQGLENALKEISLPNVSVKIGRETNIPSLLKLLPNDHQMAGYDYRLFFHSYKEAFKVGDLVKKLTDEGSFLDLDSSSYQIKEAFSTLCSSFDVSLIVFVIISFVGIGLIIGMCSFSNFISHKREAAILLALGSRDNDVSSIFINESVFVCLLSSLVSLVLLPSLEKISNEFLENQYGLSDLISVPLKSFMGFPFFLEIVVVTFSMLVSYLASSLPLYGLKRIPLATELKDE